MQKRILCLAILIPFLLSCSYKRKIDAQNISISPLLSAGMILQSDLETSIWGKAQAGGTLAVRIGDYVKLATADAKGEWKVQFPKIILDKPFSITLEGKDTTITLNNVLTGKIIVFAGDAGLTLLEDAKMKSCDKRNIRTDQSIRVFRPKTVFSDTPKEFLSAGRWLPVEEAEKISSSCIAMQIVKQLVHDEEVLGIIDISFPGSSFYNWYIGEKQNLSDSIDTSVEEISSTNNKLLKTILSMKDTCTEGLKDRISRIWFDDEYWRETKCPFEIAKKTSFPLKRIVYLRKRINVADRYIGSDFRIILGIVEGDAQYYFNDKEVIPSHDESGNTFLHISDTLMNEWTNVLAIRFFTTSIHSGIYGPEMIAHNEDSSYYKDITENWKYNFSYEDDFPVLLSMTNKNKISYNASLLPLRNFDPDYFIWYSSKTLLEEILQQEQLCNLFGTIPNSKQNLLIVSPTEIADTLIHGVNLDMMQAKTDSAIQNCTFEVIQAGK